MVSLKFVCTGYVAEWLVLVTLVHMPQRMGCRLGLGSYQWILGEFSSRVYHTGFSPAGPLI